MHTEDNYYESVIPVRQGDMIYDARNFHHIKDEAVFYNLCSKISFYRMERNLFPMDALTFYAFMDRIGVFGARIHIVATKQETEFFELKRRCIDAICHDRRDEIRDCLEKTMQLDGMNPVLKEQWENYVKYVLLVREQGHAKETYETIRKAVQCTVGNVFEFPFGERMLGSEELQYILMFLTEEMKQNGGGQDKKRGLQVQKTLDKIYGYIRKRVRDECHKAILLSRAAAMEIACFQEKADVERVEAALKSMKYNALICDIPLLLDFAARHGKGEEERKQYRKQGEVLVWLMKEYGNGYSYKTELLYSDLPQIVMAGEFLLNGRKEKNFSQDRMSEGICAVESYSRIESGRREPHRKNLEKMLGKLDLQWGYYGGVIMSGNYKCQIARIKLEEVMEQGNYEIGKRLLQTLENMLDMSILQNKQYVRMMNIILEKENGNMTGEESYNELWECLKLTNASLDTIRFYSPVEYEILYQLEKICRREMKNPEMTKRIALTYIQNESRKKFVDMYAIRFHERMLAGAYSDFHEWGKEGEIVERWLKLILEEGYHSDMLEQFLDLYSECLRNTNKEYSRAKELLASAVYMAELYEKTNHLNALKMGYQIIYDKKESWY